MMKILSSYFEKEKITKLEIGLSYVRMQEDPDHAKKKCID